MAPRRRSPPALPRPLRARSRWYIPSVSLLVTILAAVLLLFGVGVTIGTLGYRRARPRRALRAREDPLALGADPAERRRALIAETRALRVHLEELVASGRSLLGLDALVDIGSRRPLWRRLSDAGYVHNAGALREPILAWLAAEERQAHELQEVSAPARAQLVAIQELLQRGLEDTLRLAALHRSMIAAAEALGELAGELARHDPRVYR